MIQPLATFWAMNDAKVVRAAIDSFETHGDADRFVADVRGVASEYLARRIVEVISPESTSYLHFRAFTSLPMGSFFAEPEADGPKLRSARAMLS